MSQLDITPEGAKKKVTIGSILVSIGRLKEADVEHIIRYKQDKDIPFGQAGIELKLITQSDIDFALSKQFDYPYLDSLSQNLSPEVIAAYKPFSHVGESLRVIRSQLMIKWIDKDERKILPMIGPSVGAGCSFVSTNLAVLFAQQGQKTLLIDANLRTPALAGLFNVDNAIGLSTFLSDRIELEKVILPLSINNLHLLPSGPIAPNPQELLGKDAFGSLLAKGLQEYDVILIDTPPAKECFDSEIVAARVGAAVLVVLDGRTSMGDTDRVAKRLKENGVTIVGAIFNKK